MRGFPIVSLGTMTSNATFVDAVVSNSFIVAPQFELDEYFSGNKTSLDNYYSLSLMNTLVEIKQAWIIIIEMRSMLIFLQI